MTVSFWSKGWPNGDWKPFVAKRGEDGLGWQARRHSSSTQVGLTLRGTTTEDLGGRTSVASDGNWHHIAVSYNGFRKRIYVDGVLDLVFRASGTITACDQRVVFGAREWDSAGDVRYHSRVRLDDVSIYNHVLSEAQIKYLSDGGSPTNVVNLALPIGYWTFDGDDPTTNIVKDASGLGRDGTRYSGGSYTNDVPAALAGGSSLDLRGTNAYVLIDQSVISNDPADPFRLGKDITVSVWVKGWPSATWGTFVAKHGENPWGWQVRKASTSKRALWTTRGPSNGDLWGITEDAADGNWHHIACTYDGAHKILYVDGFTDRRFAATGEVRDDCYEHVILGARNDGGTPKAFGQVQLDDIAIFGQTLTPQQIFALSQGTSPTNLPAVATATPLIYDFEDGTMQGWRNVLVSRLMRPGSDNIPTEYIQEYGAGGAINAEHGNYKLEPSPYNYASNQDQRHGSLLVRSPQFVLDGSGDLRVWLIGGMGPSNSYADEFENIPLTHGSYGTMRAYLRDASDGSYLFNMRKPSSSGNPELLVVTKAQLAPYEGKTCTVELINATDGGYGWIGIDDVVIPGTLSPEAECNAIQFDMCQQRGTYNGTESPGHMLNWFTDDDYWWNGSGADLTNGQHFWANGSAAPNVKIEFGSTTNDLGGTTVSWTNEPTGAHNDTGSGIYDTFLMKDWAVVDNNNDMGIRVSGFEPGDYRVFAIIREPSALTRTYDAYFGLNINSTGDAGAIKKSVSATSATTWTKGENYVSATLRVTSEDDYITVIIDATNAQWAAIQGLQIVNVTGLVGNGTIFLLQ